LTVNAHSGKQRNNGRSVQFGLRQCQAQIGLFAVNDFYVTVSQFNQVTRTDKAVDHKANRPGNVWWHTVVVVALL
jgi:hypothetical protein